MRLAGLLLIGGLAAICTGAFLFSVPLGFVIAGGAMIYLATSTARSP